ncbi:hypothetical protein [Legionella birminghamensis]|uniref:hypothetical protein n=1 Tax=Legionella birminghamensis TaxID=28083 RepID=UPI0015591AFB|nr:hypothetical protein [Legionella birminghamensis]
MNEAQIWIASRCSQRREADGYYALAPSLRALAKQSRAEPECDTDLDCFTLFAKTGSGWVLCPCPPSLRALRSNPDRSLNATQIWIASRCSQRREADGYYALAPRHCEPWRSNPERSLNEAQIWIASRCSQRREANEYYALAPRHCEPWRSNPERSLNEAQIWIASRCS